MFIFCLLTESLLFAPVAYGSRAISAAAVPRVASPPYARRVIDLFSFLHLHSLLVVHRRCSSLPSLAFSYSLSFVFSS